MPLYSEEIQDIMGIIPGRILKIGLSVIFGILSMLLLGSYFFKYPKIISCPVVLTTLNSPLDLQAKTSGKINFLTASEHDTVTSGQIIAVIENTADYPNVLDLKKEIDRLNEISSWDVEVKEKTQSDRLKLGEIQNAYIRFWKAWENFRYYLLQNYLPIKIELLKHQMEFDKKEQQELIRQEEVQKKKFLLTVNQYRRDSTLYVKYPDAVSEADFEAQTQTFLQNRSNYMSFCSSVRKAEYDFLKLHEYHIDLEMQYEKELNVFRTELDVSFGLLKEQYNLWEEKYAIRTTISGIITFTGYWNENQLISAGERLAAVIPLEKMEIIGRAFVDMNGIGRIEKGQAVLIKLNGFPYVEHGILKGSIRNVTLVPEKEKGYIAEIDLSHGMLSSYKKHLSFIHEMDGVADIITQDERLLIRLINPIKAQLNN